MWTSSTRHALLRRGNYAWHGASPPNECTPSNQADFSALPGAYHHNTKRPWFVMSPPFAITGGSSPCPHSPCGRASFFLGGSAAAYLSAVLHSSRWRAATFTFFSAALHYSRCTIDAAATSSRPRCIPSRMLLPFSASLRFSRHTSALRWVLLDHHPQARPLPSEASPAATPGTIPSP